MRVFWFFLRSHVFNFFSLWFFLLEWFGFGNRLLSWFVTFGLACFLRTFFECIFLLCILRLFLFSSLFIFRPILTIFILIIWKIKLRDLKSAFYAQYLYVLWMTWFNVWAYSISASLTKFRFMWFFRIMEFMMIIGRWWRYVVYDRSYQKAKSFGNGLSLRLPDLSIFPYPKWESI